MSDRLDLRDACRERDEAIARAERCRLAWVSARQRAENHLLALIDSDDERDALREALREAAVA